MFISFKAITKLNLGHIDKSEIKIKKVSRRGSHSPDTDTELGHFTLILVLQRTAKKCTKNYNARAQLLFCPLKLLFATLLLPLP